MNAIVDRFLIWACCAALLPQSTVDATVVIAMLAAITVSALNGYLPSHTFCLASIAAYIGASAVWPSFCFFLPLVYYDAFGLKQAWWSLAVAAALAVCFTGLPANTSLIVAVLMAAAYVLRHRQVTLERSQTELRQLRDNSHELTMMLRQKNRELTEKQDYEIRLAMLNERSRIAREIHDHVGHLLSRSILQVGAILIAQRASDADLRQSLSVVRDTLSQAMDTIRASVHDLHDESIDLRTQI